MHSVRLTHLVAKESQLICAFDRNVSVTKNVSGRRITWDLAKENFNLLYAEGKFNENGKMIRHSFTKHTNRQFHFLNTAGYKRLNGISI